MGNEQNCVEATKMATVDVASKSGEDKCQVIDNLSATEEFGQFLAADDEQ